MLQPVTVDKYSPFLGEECALCKDPLSPGDDVIICPEDGSRHHDRCWLAHGGKCAAYGCTGHGEIASSSPPTSSAQGPQISQPDHVSAPPVSRRRQQTFSESCSQSCLVLGIAIAIIFFSIGCFGLWAIADYLMLHVWNLPYRAPFSGMLLPMFFSLYF